MAARGSLADRFADLRARAASAVVLGLVALVLILAGGAWSMVLVAVLGSLMCWEWRMITAHGGRAVDAASQPYVLAPAAGVVLAHLVAPWAGLLAVLGCALVGALLDRLQGHARRAPWGVLGACLIGTASIAFFWLRETDPYGVLAAIWIVLVVMATDMGGYFAGRLLGGPKLWPQVSPKKTWAGLAGALGLAALTGGLFSWATTGTYYDQVCTVSAAAALLAQAGDLGESALKRHFGVKDSSALLPGHGGVLDRFDGLMAASLVAAGVTLWRGQTVFIWS